MKLLIWLRFGFLFRGHFNGSRSLEKYSDLYGRLLCDA